MPRGYTSNLEKTKKCPLCKEQFSPKQGHQRFCSLKCKTKHWKSNNIVRRNDWDRTWQRKDYKKNPQKYHHKNRNREYIKRANGGGVSLKEWNEIKKKYGQLCAGCGQEKKLTQDHIIPLSKRGKHIKDNIQPLCISCNSRKKDLLNYKF